MMKYTGKYYSMMILLLQKYLKQQYGKDITKKTLQKAPAIYKDMLSKCDDRVLKNLFMKRLYLPILSKE